MLICLSAYVTLSNMDSSDADPHYSGKCGNNATFEFNPTTGVLKIEGYGEMWNREMEWEWLAYRTHITSVEMSDGITTIGNNAFYEFTSITSFTIPDSVVSIRPYAFYGCSNLTTVTIGNSVQNFWVNAFTNCTSLTSLIFPDSLTSIGLFAFQNCTSLKTVVFGNSLKEILGHAFDGCTSLENVTLPKSLSSLGWSAFSPCNSLQSINVEEGNTNYSSVDGILFNYDKTTLIQYPAGKTEGTYFIPDSVKEIFSYAFTNCTYLKSVVIPESVTTIREYAFEDCTSLVNVTMGNSVKEIQSRVFENCTSLENVTLGNSVTKIWSRAFYGCSSLKNINLPNSVTNIGSYGFCGCSSLTSIRIPSSLEKINNNVFENCTSLTSVALPDTIKYLDYYAFYGCSSLMSIDIPDSVYGIGFQAFFGCTSLSSINVSSENSVYSSKDGVLFDKNQNILIIYPACKNDASYILPSTVVRIYEYAFYGNIYLEKVTLYENVESIEKSAFYGCTYLKSINISKKVSTIQDYAFKNCSSLTSIYIPDSVTKIGKDVLLGCTSLQKIEVGENNSNFSSMEGVLFDKNKTTLIQYPVNRADSSYLIPYTVTSVGSSAFYGCTSLKSLTISHTVESIGDNAFFGCTSLTYIKVNENNAKFCSIDGVLFNKEKTELILYPIGNTNESYEVPGDVKSIKADAFRGCTYLVSITIPSTVTSLGTSAFYGCTGLKELSIPVNLNCVGSNDNPAFEGCVNIECITFVKGTSGSWYNYNSDNLKYTPWQLSKSSLTTVIISDGVTSIGESAFKDCKNLKELTVPVTVNCVVSDQNPVFEGCSNLEKITFVGNGAWHTYELSNIYTPWQLSKSTLTTVSISEGVTSLEESAFKGCTSLKELTVPANIDCVVSTENPVFEGCTNIEKITFVGNGAWHSRNTSDYEYTPWQLSKSSLTTVIISDNLTSIGEFAFSGCRSLSSVTIGKSVSAFGSSTFKDCISLTSIVVDEANENLCSVDNIIFSKDMTSIIMYPISKTDATYEIPKSVISIGDYAFKDCISLKYITIPDHIKSIGASAFENCTELASVEILGSETTLGTYAFVNCSGLKELLVPVSVDCAVSEKYPAFSGCTNIDKITFTKGTGIWHQYDEADYENTPWHITGVPLDVEIADGLTTIGERALFKCTSLRSIIIPGSVSSIDAEAFYNCGFTSMIIPDSVTTLGKSAFKDCFDLKELTVPASLDCVGSISDPAFDGCCSIENITFTKGSGAWYSYDSTNYQLTPWQLSNSVLTKIVISDGVTFIGDYAFAHSNITSLSIPDSVKSIGDYAFHGCISLSDMKISGSATSIGDHAFDGCTTITTISIPDSVTTLGNSIFKDCVALTTVVLGESIISIGKCAFSSCKSLLSISLPDSLKSIDEKSFEGCESLSTLNLGRSIERIGNHAFKDCSSITSVTIPESVSSIGSSVFQGCNNLKELTVPASLDCVGSISDPIFDGCGSIENITFTKGSGAWYPYDSTNYHLTPWQLSKSVLTKVTISDCVTSIGDHAFQECVSLSDVKIPGSTVSIGDHAFEGCISITTITLPDPITTLGESTFSSCKSLHSISLPDSLKTIGAKAFEDCVSLSTLNLGRSVEKIGDHAFKGCTSIISLTIPESVSSIGSLAFQGCINLKELTVPVGLDCVGSIVSPIFSECVNIENITFTKGTGTWYAYEHSDYEYTPWQLSRSMLTSINICDGVTSIGKYSFKDCSNLVSLTIPDTVTTIEKGAFNGCSGMKRLTVPASLDCVVSNIDPVFYDCVNIENITFTKGTGAWYPYGESGAEHSYYACTPWQLSKDALNSVVIEEGVRYIGNNSFKDCSKLTSISIGSSVTFLGYSTFQGCTALGSIVVDDENTEFSSVENVLFNKEKTSLILYPAGKTNTAYSIPGSVKYISDRAFYECTALTSITFPDTIAEIGDSSFNIVFYDADGETVLEPTAANLAGSTFALTEGIWVKQIISTFDMEVVYTVFAIFIVGILSGIAVLSRRKA